MTTKHNPDVRVSNGDCSETNGYFTPLPLTEGGRLEWLGYDRMPTTLTARRFRRDDEEMWVATKCGVYVSTDALLAKHREMVEAHPDACVIRLSVSEFDWVARAERRGRRIA